MSFFSICSTYCHAILDYGRDSCCCWRLPGGSCLRDRVGNTEQHGDRFDYVEYVPLVQQVEAGDVILRVNEVDVNRFTTKEVLKCLRLSSDPVTLKLRRDPAIKAHVRRLLSPGQQTRDCTETSSRSCRQQSGGGEEVSSENHSRQTENHEDKSVNRKSSSPELPVGSPQAPIGASQYATRSNGSYSDASGSSEFEALLPQIDSFKEEERAQWEPLSGDKFSRQKNTPRFEAYMMTGDLMLNLSRTQQSTGLLPKYQKKVDSLRYNNHHMNHHNHHNTHNYHHHHHHHHHNSVPTSPNEMLGHHRGYKGATGGGSNSASTSPVGISKRESITSQCPMSGDNKTNSNFGYSSGFVRTSRSEDHLQFQKDPSMSAVDIDIDDDVTSSLNTLLDTRPDSGQGVSSERIVWTYNAPVSSPSASERTSCCQNGSSSQSSSSSSTEGTSPQRSLSPASPTSVSSSVMSSNSGSRRFPLPSNQIHPGDNCNATNNPTTNTTTATTTVMSSSITSNQGTNNYLPTNGDLSQSEAISNMSSPDYNDEETMDILSARDIMMELKESEDEFLHVGGMCDEQKPSGTSPPQSADEESDIESLHSFHYSPKAVDLPSAIRLAKRLYSLDGFKKSDVSRHLSKNNDFSRAVAEEYLRYFSFERDTLDVALRKFLAQFSLTGETQERERVLVHFSKRYLDCNPGSFNSQDAVHTLTCAIMLLNTDLHGQNIGRKMSCAEFIENLSELNDGDNFPRDVLKQLYTAIKSFPLEWALDEEGDDSASQVVQQGDGPTLSGSGNPFLDVPNVTGATEFKKGYVMRKSCYDANGKKTPFGKRGWKMYYCTLRELVLYLHKDEHGFRNDSLHNAVRIHHALATKASDYTKKQHVFRLQTADQAEYLFQTSDSKELQSWIDTINFVCASFSCQPLAGAVGSQRKFQRPLLPCSHTKLAPREQLRDHEERVNRLEAELDEHRRHPPERGAKALTVQNYKEKDAYLHYELKRYKTYAYLLRSRLAFTEVEPSLVESCIGEVDESGSGALLNAEVALVPPPVPDRPATNRYSYRAAIYNRNLLNDQDYSGDVG
ncbi:PH and SEC7 domain-containing protein isoform X6 [Venturia canescens]|uniref:PH and SEC7 domain-containing protein isoform X6 n=1 Tax=Venturia canescens TaxID=32260 RepID=UPI001C9C5B13|nr:PH and SEC7 domain-containing protein isoform X6 [Venturia canescens]